MELELLAGSVCLALAITLLAMGFLGEKDEKDELASVQERISQLAQSAFEGPSVATAQSSRDRQLQQSFTQRVIFPLAQSIFDISQGLIPLSNKSWVKIKLTQAGYTKPHYPKIFLGLQLLCCSLLFGCLFGLNSLVGKLPGFLGIFLALFFGGAGYGMPLLWLTQEVKKRQTAIQKSLPDFIDLLVICVEAGLGLDLAIQKITSLKAVNTSPFLREELVKYLRDIGFGKARKASLQALSLRVGLDDLTSVVNALIQSYEMGTGVAHTLRVQSETLRIKRIQRAEEKANKIPVKMIIPIYVFLFPAIFVAMGGPLAVMMIKSITNIMEGMAPLGG